MKIIKILSLCDGISCGKMAFENLGIKVEYYAVEINERSRKISDHNNSDIKRFENDVELVTEEMIEKHGPFDWAIMGPTCKSVSSASNGKGLLGSSRILFNCLRIKKWCKKYNPEIKYIIENVKMKDKFYEDFCKLIGHDATLINSGPVSAQERLRYYWTNFKVEMPVDKKIMFNDILDDDASHALGWSKSSRYKDNSTGKVYSAPAKNRTYYIEERFKTNGKSNTLMATKHCKGQSTSNIVFLKDGNKRFLSLNECKKLQTINESFDFSPVSESIAYRCIGDGWNVKTIEHIISQAIK